MICDLKISNNEHHNTGSQENMDDNSINQKDPTPLRPVHNRSTRRKANDRITATGMNDAGGAYQ